MDREKSNNAAMFAQESERDGLMLQPFTLAIGQLLEEKGNRFASGGNFKPKMGEMNELMFVMCHAVEDVIEIADEDWRKEVLRFAATLTAEQIQTIQTHTEEEIEKLNLTQTTTPGKPKRKAARNR